MQMCAARSTKIQSHHLLHVENLWSYYDFSTTVFVIIKELILLISLSILLII